MTGCTTDLVLRHHDRIRKGCPHDRLLILLDIDDTLLERRSALFYALNDYDRAHGTTFFRSLRKDDVAPDSSWIHQVIDAVPLSMNKRADLYEWCLHRSFSRGAIGDSCRFFAPVLDLILRLHALPETFVGFNTGRPESERISTVYALSVVADVLSLTFDRQLLFMNRHDPGGDVATSKVAGIVHFQRRGYRVFACVDSDHRNLAHIGEVDPLGQIFLVHTGSLLEREGRKPLGAPVRGGAGGANRAAFPTLAAV